jgi:hypothetical protein
MTTTDLKGSLALAVPRLVIYRPFRPSPWAKPALPRKRGRWITDLNGLVAVQYYSFGLVLFGHPPKFRGDRSPGRAACIACKHNREFRCLSMCNSVPLPDFIHSIQMFKNSPRLQRQI